MTAIPRPWSWHRLGHWSEPDDRRCPLAILGEQARNRISWLLPIRHERMGAGDAHLLNFGFYASPERTLLFDIVDFDETYPGPFEWDLKRLLTSLVLVLQARGTKAEACERAAGPPARKARI
jgi:uncharacterized protein (DUF2252 family)